MAKDVYLIWRLTGRRAVVESAPDLAGAIRKIKAWSRSHPEVMTAIEGLGGGTFVQHWQNGQRVE